jgi:hypothetical protein
MESQVIEEINKKVASQFPELNLQFASPGEGSVWVVVLGIAVVAALLLYHYRKLD